MGLTKFQILVLRALALILRVVVAHASGAGINNRMMDEFEDLSREVRGLVDGR